ATARNAGGVRCSTWPRCWCTCRSTASPVPTIHWARCTCCPAEPPTEAAMDSSELELPDPCLACCHLLQESWDAAGMSSQLQAGADDGAASRPHEDDDASGH